VTPPTRIAVGYDGSRDADAALSWAASVAAALGAEVRVIHAVGILEHAGLSVVSAHEERARLVASRAGLDPARFEWRVLDGDPDSVLCRVAEGEDGADLLVVGTRGAGAHPDKLLGSTSLCLAERAPVPVVVVPVPSEDVTRSSTGGAVPARG
jgi:nucleotide-binding universal stress UspA family protein